jgi:glucose-1-phosphatase
MNGVDRMDGAVSTVLFDLGGVVCRFVPERRLAVLAADCGLTPAEVRARVWDSGIDAGCDLGRYSAEEMYEEIRRALGLRMEYAAFRVAWATAFEPDPAVLSIIERLAGRCRTALLTDNGPVLREGLPLLLPEVAGRLDPLLFSCELGARKPAPDIFIRALARLGESPERVLFIDDSAAAVEGARRVGLVALHFTDAASLARVVDRMLGSVDGGRAGRAI